MINQLSNYPSTSSTSIRRLTQMPGLSDDELARAASAGNEAAFAELLARHRKLIVWLVRRYFSRHDEIEELVQISFIEAWAAIRAYRGGGPRSFVFWLSRIATHSCYDELRRRRRSREDIFSQLGEGDSAFLCERLSVQLITQSLEQTAISRDLADKLLTALEPDDRLVFMLLKAENLSITEIATLTGWSEAKVKMRVHRSRSILQRRLRRLM